MRMGMWRCVVLGGETWLLGYDAEGNLVDLQKRGDSVGWVYEYDGFGRRVRGVRGVGGGVLVFG